MLTQFNIEDLLFYQIALERGMKKGVEQGIEKGMEKGKLVEKQQLAQIMLRKGLTMAIITDITGLTELEILKLSNN